jgi:O-antigen ligase
MVTVAYAALWVFVFSVPWERIIVMPGVVIVPKATGAVALGLALVAVVMTGRFRRWHPFHVWALLFWGWAGLGLMLFHFSPRLPAKFWTFAQLLLVVWMMWELAPAVKRIRGLMVAYVLGGYVAALDTIWLYRRQAKELNRFAAGGADPNDLAMVLALSVAMAWYLGLTATQAWLRWVCRAYLPVAIVAIGLTGSRGGMIATTVALLIVPLSMMRLSPGRLTSAIFVLGLAGVLAVAYTPETLIQRLSTTGSELEGGRLGGRGKLWKAGLQVSVEAPFFGHGTAGFKEAITPILGEATQVAHNSFISVLVEEGFVGLVLFLVMLSAVFFSLLRLPPLERRFAIVLMATLGVALLPLTWEDRRAVWVVLSILVGLSQAYATGAIGTTRPAPSPVRTPEPVVRDRRIREPAVVGVRRGPGPARA